MSAGTIKEFFSRTGLIIVYLFFFIGLIFSFRAVSSISIGLLLVVGLFQYKNQTESTGWQKWILYFIGGCFLLLFLEAFSILQSQDRQTAIDNLRIKSAMVAIPVALWLSRKELEFNRRILVILFCLVLTAASLYCLLFQLIKFRASFYHTLVAPIGQHAVYFSIYVFIALVFLIESWKTGEPIFPKPLQWILIIFLSAMLLLLSSRLILAWYAFYLLFSIYILVKNGKVSKKLAIPALLVLIGMALITLLSSNPISNRFNDILQRDLVQLKKDQYTPGDYFNGLEFRMLQWKWVPSILNEQDAWLMGTGTGDGQAALDSLYRSKNMYKGEAARGDKGYLGYNTHNQFLQALLEVGLVGLVLFVFCCASLLMMAVRRGGAGVIFITGLVLMYCFSEAVLETQYGVVLFGFFPMWSAFSFSRNRDS